MLKVSKRVFDEHLCHYRKIHIYKDYYLVSIYSKCSKDGRFHLNLHNIFLFPLTFIYRVVKVIPNMKKERIC